MGELYLSIYGKLPVSIDVTTVSVKQLFKLISCSFTIMSLKLNSEIEDMILSTTEQYTAQYKVT